MTVTCNSRIFNIQFNNFLFGSETEAEPLSAEEVSSLSQSQSQKETNDEDYVPCSGSDSSSSSGSSEVSFNYSIFNYFRLILSQDQDNDKSKVIVYMRLLISLFQVCRMAGCGSLVDRDDIKIVTDGAMITVTCVCVKNHRTQWKSSPVLHQESTHPVGEINIVLATYILTCGLHIKQVTNTHHTNN